MNEDFCSYELSMALKAAGFDEPCGKGVKIIPGTEREEWDEEECQWCTVQDIEYYPKITLCHAQKWLREKKGIVVVVMPFPCDYRPIYYWSLYDLRGGNVGSHIPSMRETYEQALSAGISAALELIKKGE